MGSTPKLTSPKKGGSIKLINSIFKFDNWCPYSPGEIDSSGQEGNGWNGQGQMVISDFIESPRMFNLLTV